MAGSPGSPGSLHRLLPPSDGTVDVLHGVEIADPFRPLEDASRADVRAWVDAEDARASAMLAANPLHAEIVRFMEAGLRYPRSSSLRKAGQHWFALAFDGAREQPWLEARATIDGPGSPLIDPNAMAPGGGRLGLSGWYPDGRGARIAYLTTLDGGDEQTLRVRDLKSGGDLPDVLTGCRWTTVVWLADGQSFYYTRPPLAREPAHWDRTSHLVFLHRLGQPQSADRMVFRLPGRNVFLSLSMAHGTSQLLVTARIGTDIRNGLWAGPMADPALLTMLVPIGLGSFRVIRSIGGAHWAITTAGAPRGRIVRLRQIDPRPEAWETLVPEGKGVIDSAIVVAGRLVVRRLEDLSHRLSIHDDQGRFVREVPVEDGSRIVLEAAEPGEHELHVDIDSHRFPRRRDRLNVTTGVLRTVEPIRSPHDLSDMVVQRSAVEARDGTRIPVTVMHRPGLVRDGSNRALMIGYGSYGVPQLPGYSTLAAAWVRLGGVYVSPALRGGGEFGTGWHESGRRAAKQTTMDDFAAVARWLVSEGITRPDRLGIHGGSSGGRLVLASILQRPELFGAAVAGVPIADMLRFHRFTFGVAWTQEYGDPDRADDFRWLRAHSPLHNVRAGAKYPPLLLLTGDNDQRVAPCHAWKMAATLGRLAPGSEVWLRTRKGAGHGSGNAHGKWLDYQADVVSFLVSRLGGAVLELPAIGGARSVAVEEAVAGKARE